VDPLTRSFRLVKIIRGPEAPSSAWTASEAAPAAFSHVDLGVVQAECLDPDQHLIRGGHGIAQLGDGQDLRAAVGRDDGLHARSFLELPFIYFVVKRATGRWPGNRPS
jgi:hypothetical protein